MEKDQANTSETSPKDSGTNVPTTQDAEEKPGELQGFRLNLVAFALALSTLLMGLDVTIVATAVPTITTEFNSLADISWYGNAYFITSCTFQFLAANLYVRYSHVWVYVSSVVIFEIGSLVSALAPSSAALIVGRAISGIGSAGIISGSLIVISSIVRKELQPSYVALVQSSHVIAELIGPVIGGAFTQRVTWRWCFWINLPIGGLTALVLALFLRSRHPGSRSTLASLKDFDLVGFVLLSGSIVLVLLATQFGGSYYPWNSSVIIGLYCGAFVAVVVFALQQWRLKDSAYLPLNIATHRTVFFASLVIGFGSGGFAVLIYYLQVWFQVVKGASPLSGGLMYFPTVISDVVTAVIASVIVTKTPYYNPLLVFGLASLGTGSALMTGLGVDSGAGDWIGYQILGGVGFALLVQMPIVAVQRDLPSDQVPMGTTMVVFAQTLGFSLFLAVAQAAFIGSLRSQLATQAPTVDRERIIAVGATGVRGVVDPDQLSSVLTAYNSAVTRIFYITVTCAFTAFILAWGLPWRRATPAKPDGDEKDEKGDAEP